MGYIGSRDKGQGENPPQSPFVKGGCNLIRAIAKRFKGLRFKG